jgi:hypothetical protein
MAMRQITLVALYLTSFACFGSDGCTTATEFQPALCTVNFPKVSSIQIAENGAKSPAEDDAVDCSGFKLTDKAIRRFFDRAQEANGSDAHHTLDWSPCYASGTLVFNNGQKAQWSINQFQTGSLSIEGEERIFLYCPRCKYHPFRW